MDNLDEILDKAPDQVADALEDWRMKTLQREKAEALLYLEFKAKETKLTADEVKSHVRSSQGYFDAKLAELKAEAKHQRLYERLLSAKHRARMRVAI